MEIKTVTIRLAKPTAKQIENALAAKQTDSSVRIPVARNPVQVQANMYQPADVIALLTDNSALAAKRLAFVTDLLNDEVHAALRNQCYDDEKFAVDFADIDASELDHSVCTFDALADQPEAVRKSARVALVEPSAEEGSMFRKLFADFFATNSEYLAKPGMTADRLKSNFTGVADWVLTGGKTIAGDITRLNYSISKLAEFAGEGENAATHETVLVFAATQLQRRITRVLNKVKDQEAITLM